MLDQNTHCHHYENKEITIKKNKINQNQFTVMTKTVTMITDLLNINVAMNCYKRAQALHAI